MATHADISGNLTIGAGQSVRRNASNTGFEAYTPTGSEGGESYLVYSALLTQAGTTAPVAAVLQNTLGYNVAWTRGGAGQYGGSLVGSAFPDNAFIMTASIRGVGTTGATYAYGAVNTISHTIDFVTAYLSITPSVTITQVDDALTDTPIEIRIYSSQMSGRSTNAASVVGTLSGPIYGAITSTGTARATGSGAGAMGGGATGSGTARGTLTA